MQRLKTKIRGQIGFEDAATEFVWGSSNSIDRADDVVHQLVRVEGAAVGEVPFGQRPNAFIGIELRSVRGKVLEVQTRVPIGCCATPPPTGGGVPWQASKYIVNL